jgi:hypothetical protein
MKFSQRRKKIALQAYFGSESIVMDVAPEELGITSPGSTQLDNA